MALRGSVSTMGRAVRPRRIERIGALPTARIAPLVAVLSAAAAAAAVVMWGALGAGIAAVLITGTLAARVDLRCGRLPDAIVLSGAALGVVTVCHATVQHGSPVVAAAAAGAAALGVPPLAVHLVSPAAMGFGDVKLGAVLGLVLGLLDWRWAVLALAIASGSTLAAAVTRRRTIPFGPGLAAGAAAAVLIASFAPVADGGPLGWDVAPWR